jgi:hypothetical protein
VPLQNGVAHFFDGILRLRRFRKPDQGGADFLIGSTNAISALLTLAAELTKRATQITEPDCCELADDYFCYWTPGKKTDVFTVTLALEPMGFPGWNAPFSLTLTELNRIAAAVRVDSQGETT